MGNLTVPTPIAVVGGGLCVLAGYLVGLATGSEPSTPLTAEVASFERSNDRLCLSGAAVEDHAESVDGELCGTWRRTAHVAAPRVGDSFRFVTMSGESRESGEETLLFIYGEPAD
jgi:hypothetical protein